MKLLKVITSTVLLATSTIMTANADVMNTEWKTNVAANTSGSSVTELLGAVNINVGGSFYNVDFVDGSCLSLFTACGGNGTNSFAFNNEVDAKSASDALLAQVFLDIDDGAPEDFDSSPSLMAGCTAAKACKILTPYAVDGTNVQTIQTTNSNDDTKDATISNVKNKAYDYNSGGPQNSAGNNIWQEVYAIWTSIPSAQNIANNSNGTTSVPEPTSIAILALGLIGLRLRKTKK